MPGAPPNSVGRRVAQQLTSFVLAELKRRDLPHAKMSRAVGRTDNAIDASFHKGIPMSLELAIDVLDVLGYRLVVEPRTAAERITLG